jgi:cytochrome c-type biogenesis protein
MHDGRCGKYGNHLVAGIFFLVDFHLFDIIPMPWSGPGNIALKRKGILAAFILGFIFGIALGPCTFAYMAPILSITLQVSASQMWYGVLLLLFYAMGHCSFIVLAGTFTEVVQRYLNWTIKRTGNSKKGLWRSRHTGWILFVIYGVLNIPSNDIDQLLVVVGQ